MFGNKGYTGIPVVFLCYTRNGRLLMEKKFRQDDETAKKWDAGRGQLRLKETSIHALRREVMERYGAGIIRHECLGNTYDYIIGNIEGETIKTSSIDFKVLVDINGVINGKPDEIEAIGWFSMNSLPSTGELHPQFLVFLQKYKDRL